MIDDDITLTEKEIEELIINLNINLNNIYYIMTLNGLEIIAEIREDNKLYNPYKINKDSYVDGLGDYISHSYFTVLNIYTDDQYIEINVDNILIKSKPNSNIINIYLQLIKQKYYPETITKEMFDEIMGLFDDDERKKNNKYQNNIIYLDEYYNNI